MNDYIPAKKLSEAIKTADDCARRKIRVYFAAGTTDLYVQMKDGAVEQPNVLVDISQIPELKKISIVANALSIGAGATFAEIIKNPLCLKYAPLLVEAAKEIGSPLIRNRATIGGNIANSSPAGDSIPPLVALGAKVVIKSAKTTRSIPLENFFTGPKRNILRNGELILKIIIPKNNFNFYKFLKLGSRKALAISKVSLAFAAKINSDRSIPDVKIAAGAVGPTVIRCQKTEQFLMNTKLSDISTSCDTINKAKEILSSEISPIDDFRSNALYRRQATANLLEEIILELSRR